MRIEVLLDLKTRLGESPVWDVEQQRLWWVDSLDGRLFACNAQGGAIKSWDVRQKIGSFALRQSGEGAVVALQNGVHLLDFASGELTLLHHPEADRPFNRLNDGKVDRQGRFLFGSMDMREEEPSGALYRLDPDLTLTLTPGGAHHAVATPRSKHDYDNNQSHTCRRTTWQKAADTSLLLGFATGLLANLGA